jgi:hypothetical protein
MALGVQEEFHCHHCRDCHGGCVLRTAAMNLIRDYPLRSKALTARPWERLSSLTGEGCEVPEYPAEALTPYLETPAASDVPA